MSSLVWGTLILVVITATSAEVSWGVARRCYGQDLLAALAGAAVLWAAFVVVVLEVLGLAGWLAPIPLLLAVVLLWLGYRTFSSRHPPTRHPPVPHPPAPHPPARHPPNPGNAAWLLRTPRPTGIGWLAALAAAALCLLLAASIIDAWAYPHLEFDALYYHLPIPVEWLQAHNLRLLPYLGPNIQAARFPGNFELTHLWLMLPLHRGTFVQLAPSLGLGMTVLGTTLLARALGARVRLGLAAALVVVTLPCVLVSLIGSGFGDLFMAGALTLAAAFLAHFQTTGQRRDVVLAGAAAGLALGARYQALLDVIPLFAIALAVVLARPRRGARAWRDLALAAGALLVTGGYFYARNAVATGNPLYPKAWSLPFHSFPGARLDACCEQPSWIGLGWQPHLWAASAKGVLLTNRGWGVGHAWGPMLAVLLVSGCAVPVVAALCRRERPSLAWTWALYPVAQVIVFLLTPNSAGYGGIFAAINARFMLVPLTASAALLAVEVDRLTPARRRVILTATLLAALGCTIALSSGITRAPLPPAPSFLVLLVPLGILSWLAPRVRIRRRLFSIALLALAAALVGFAPQLGAHFWRNQRNLAFSDAAAHLSRADHVVSVVGICEIYSLYGPRLERRVIYVTGASGIDPPLATTYPQWLDGLRRNHVTAVVEAIRPEACFPRTVPLPQTAWLALHPHRFVLRARTPTALVYSVRDP